MDENDLYARSANVSPPPGKHPVKGHPERKWTVKKNVVLYGENNRALKLEFLDAMVYNGDEYVLLLDREGSGVILRCGPDGESYYGIEDPVFLDKLLCLFKEKAADLDIF